MEIMRLGVVAPITVPHVAMQDTTCLGYTIPKVSRHLSLNNWQATSVQIYSFSQDTIFFINLWSVSMESALWENPLQFRPERHLDVNGNVVKSEYLLPFGLGALITDFWNFIKLLFFKNSYFLSGKRICLGESLARSTIFLFFTSIMQRFRFSMPINPSDSNLIPTLNPIPGLTLGPYPCLAHVTERNLIS